MNCPTHLLISSISFSFNQATQLKSYIKQTMKTLSKQKGYRWHLRCCERHATEVNCVVFIVVIVVAEGGWPKVLRCGCCVFSDRETMGVHMVIEVLKQFRFEGLLLLMHKVIKMNNKQEREEIIITKFHYSKQLHNTHT